MSKFFKRLIFRLFYRKKFLVWYRNFCYIQKYFKSSTRPFPCNNPVKFNDVLFPCGNCYFCKQARKVIDIFKGVENAE